MMPEHKFHQAELPFPTIGKVGTDKLLPQSTAEAADSLGLITGGAEGKLRMPQFVRDALPPRPDSLGPPHLIGSSAIGATVKYWESRLNLGSGKKS